MINQTRKETQFIKFIDSKCVNLKNEIDQLLSEIFLIQFKDSMYQEQNKSTEFNYQVRNENIIKDSSIKMGSISNQLNNNCSKIHYLDKNSQDNSNEIYSSVQKYTESNENNTLQKENSNSNLSLHDKQITKNDLTESNQLKMQDEIDQIKELENNKITTNQKFDMLSFLKSINNYDCESTKLKQIQNQRNQLLFSKKLSNGKRIQKTFSFLKSNLQTNLSILNQIQKMYLNELNIDSHQYQLFLNEINNKQNLIDFKIEDFKIKDFKKLENANNI